MKKFTSLTAALLCLGMLFAGCSSAKPAETSATSSVTETTTVTTSESTSESKPKRVYPDNCIIDPTVLDRLEESITLDFKDKTIIETGSVNGRRYSFTIDLSNWAGNTAAYQIGELSRLFWQVYPALYVRFGTLSNAPCHTERLGRRQTGIQQLY